MLSKMDLEFFHKLNDSYHRMSPEQMAEIERGNKLMTEIENHWFEIAVLRCHFQRELAANLMVALGSNIKFHVLSSDLLTITCDDEE